jgi:hypothetical protein
MKYNKVLTGLFLITALFFFIFKSFGQEEPNIERMESMRIAFFTEKLSLTKAEAEKFWPVFNDYANRKEKINADRRNLFRYIQRNGDYLSEKEVNESLEKYINLEKEDKELSELFNQKFLEILPAKKVLKIYLADHQFKVFILNQIRENRPIRPGQGGRGPRGNMQNMQ